MYLLLYDHICFYIYWYSDLIYHFAKYLEELHMLSKAPYDIMLKFSGNPKDNKTKAWLFSLAQKDLSDYVAENNLKTIQKAFLLL